MGADRLFRRGGFKLPAQSRDAPDGPQHARAGACFDAKHAHGKVPERDAAQPPSGASKTMSAQESGTDRRWGGFFRNEPGRAQRLVPMSVSARSAKNVKAQGVLVDDRIGD